MKKHGNNGSVSPHPKVYGTRADPTSLERERTVESQLDRSENIIKWGIENNLPLLVLDAINQSPTTLSCLGITESFIKGAGFTDEKLMEVVIDKDGTTLWELHCQLAPYLTNLEGFATNFKFDQAGRILNTYVMYFESCRFVNPVEGSKKIEYIKFNPYFGTTENKQELTQEFPVWNKEEVLKQAHDKKYDKKHPYPGQIYFCGTVRAPFKFYPVPKYWSGEKWIYVDSQIQQFHKSNLDNGFFQSVLLNVIGNPNAMSTNPAYKTQYEKDDGTKVMENRTTTNAMEFDQMMSGTFSGVKKAGSVFTLWSSNADNATKVQAFPVTTNFDVLSGTFTDAIRGITIATEVPAILANLPQSVNSLGSDGNSMLRAVEIMQSRTEARRITLENFYNNILLPNLVKPIKTKVKIKQYAPVSLPVTMDKQFWDWMNDEEKAAWMEKNMPGIKLFRTAATPAPTVDPETGQPVPAPQEANEAMKKLNLQQITRASKITQRFATGELTYDQAKQILLGYGFTEADIPAWLPQVTIEA